MLGKLVSVASHSATSDADHSNWHNNFRTYWPLVTDGITSSAPLAIADIQISLYSKWIRHLRTREICDDTDTMTEIWRQSSNPLFPRASTLTSNVENDRNRYTV